MSLNNQVFTKDKLTVKVYPTIPEMGKAAAEDVSKKIRELLLKKEHINMIFAAAPSQEEFLKNLIADPRIEWSRINAFHMDEYIGLPQTSSKSFAFFMKEKLFSKLPFRKVFYLNGGAENAEVECERYAKLLKDNPVDIVCLGIGENGHIAFNDPGVADFNDKKIVKIVEIDEVCRQQQVNEKCFDTLDSVPKQAMTLTVPALTAADWMFCVVPFHSKAPAVKKAVEGEITEDCPSSILRTKENAFLYLEKESARLLA